VVDIVVDVRNFLAIRELDQALGLLLHPRVSKVNEMPSNMLSIVLHILRVVPVSVSKEK
jgi:hypothetical protein